MSPAPIKILKQETTLSYRSHAEVSHATEGRFVPQSVVQELYLHHHVHPMQVLRFHTEMTNVWRTPLIAEAASPPSQACSRPSFEAASERPRSFG